MTRGKWLVAGLCTLAVTACSSPSETPAADKTQVTPPQAEAPVSGNAPPPATADAARTITLNTQGVAPIGLTVRVKGIELGTDATLLNVSASYGGTQTNNIPLASDPTYLQDEQGNKLMLKPPTDNPRLNIIRGQQMDGQLVFLGAVPQDAKALTLVFNNNNPGDDIIAPGLSIPLKLDAASQ